MASPSVATGPQDLPYLLTVAEVADLLRTTKAAIYHRVERALIPGVVKDGSRVLFLRDDVLGYIAERRAVQPRSPGR